MLREEWPDGFVVVVSVGGLVVASEVMEGVGPGWWWWWW